LTATAQVGHLFSGGSLSLNLNRRDADHIDGVTEPTAVDVTTLFPTLMLPLVSLPELMSKFRVAVTNIERADKASLVLSK
jgi:hypothetical protein